MNRRSFFSKFGLLAAAASVSPTIFIPKFEPVKWKVKSIINPAWVAADYEVHFLMDSTAWVNLIKRKTFPPNMGETTRNIGIRVTNDNQIIFHRGFDNPIA
jgi:hypothetical protein